jgi:preprotein translocase subunit SecG
MDIIIGFVVFLFVPVCVVLTLIILLQDSKGEGLSSSAFGGAEMQSVLGGRGAATFLGKLTTWLAIGFMVISLFLMRFYGEGGDGALTPIEEETTQEATTEPVDTTDEEGSVETTTGGDGGGAADDTSKTELDSGTTDSTE